jgi:hypothetical protein
MRQDWDHWYFVKMMFAPHTYKYKNNQNNKDKKNAQTDNYQPKQKEKKSQPSG